MEEIRILSGLCVGLALLTPIIVPSCLKSDIFLVNVPFIVFVGIGSINSLDEASSFHPAAQAAAHLGMAAYIALILMFTYSKKFNKSCSSELGSLRPGALDSISIRRTTALLVVLILLACIPYWLEIGFFNTGMIALIHDPANHLVAREQTIKLAGPTQFLALYKVGASLGSLAVTFVWALILSQKRHHLGRRIFLIVMITALSNINGSRSEFVLPTIIGFASLYFMNFNSWRDSSMLFLRNTRRGLVRLSAAIRSAQVIVATFAVFAFMVFISIQRLARFVTPDLISDVISSVLRRTLAVPFTTGIVNIEAIHSLGLSVASYFGGFPGFTFLFGERESTFMVSGRYYMLKYMNTSDSSMNLNTSGLFLNIAFWGVAFGVLLFTGYILFNTLVFRKYAGLFTSSPDGAQFATIFSSWVLSSISFNIVSSTISVFPLLWIYFPVLMLYVSRFPCGFLRKVI